MPDATSTRSEARHSSNSKALTPPEGFVSALRLHHPEAVRHHTFITPTMSCSSLLKGSSRSGATLDGCRRLPVASPTCHVAHATRSEMPARRRAVIGCSPHQAGSTSSTAAQRKFFLSAALPIFRSSVPSRRGMGTSSFSQETTADVSGGLVGGCGLWFDRYQPPTTNN